MTSLLSLSSLVVRSVYVQVDESPSGSTPSAASSITPVPLRRPLNGVKYGLSAKVIAAPVDWVCDAVNAVETMLSYQPVETSVSDTAPATSVPAPAFVDRSAR